MRLAGTGEFWAFVGQMEMDDNTRAIIELLIAAEPLRDRARDALGQIVTRFDESHWEAVLWRDDRVIALLSLAEVVPDITDGLHSVLLRALAPSSRRGRRVVEPLAHPCWLPSASGRQHRAHGAARPSAQPLPKPAPR